MSQKQEKQQRRKTEEHRVLLFLVFFMFFLPLHNLEHLKTNMSQHIQDFRVAIDLLSCSQEGFLQM